MVMAEPHFLLFCNTHVSGNEIREPNRANCGGRWHFVLEKIGGAERLEAGDAEAPATRDRLDLLAVVRGLEALEQPSQVTLVTTSRYVARGLRYGLNSWRESDYHWERFGVQMPIRNADLWQRVDVALKFHGLTCRLIQVGIGAAPARDVDMAGESPAGLTLQPTPAVLDLASPPARPRFAASLSRPTAPAASWLCLRKWLEVRWKFAISWIRWWKSRLQAYPATYGT